MEAVRLDSGDLGALAHEVRAILDAGGCSQVRIVASGNLDEHEIEGLLAGGAPIDAFGVGTRLDVSADAPYLDCVYKLQEYAGRPRRKRSAGKATWPGRKQVFRELRRGGPHPDRHDRARGRAAARQAAAAARHARRPARRAVVAGAQPRTRGKPDRHVAPALPQPAPPAARRTADLRRVACRGRAVRPRVPVTTTPTVHAGRDLVEGLLRASAYPHAVTEPIRLAETHISWVLLTGDFAYKVKKPLQAQLPRLLDARAAPRTVRGGTAPQPAPGTRACTSASARSPAPRSHHGSMAAGPARVRGAHAAVLAGDELAALLAAGRADRGRPRRRWARPSRASMPRLPRPLRNRPSASRTTVQRVTLDNFAELRALPESAAWQDRLSVLERGSSHCTRPACAHGGAPARRAAFASATATCTAATSCAGRAR